MFSGIASFQRKRSNLTYHTTNAEPHVSLPPIALKAWDGHVQYVF
jgi:hypothetical protein